MTTAGIQAVQCSVMSLIHNRFGASAVTMRPTRSSCSGVPEWPTCVPRISADLGVPVVDGVTAATLAVQSLVTMGLTTGDKRGEFAPPPPKLYSGLLQDFTTSR